MGNMYKEVKYKVKSNFVDNFPDFQSVATNNISGGVDVWSNITYCIILIYSIECYTTQYTVHTNFIPDAMGVHQ